MAVSNFQVKKGIQTTGSAGDVFSDIVPVGTVALWPATSIPNGWLACDGSTFNSTEYPQLASVLGDTYGQSSGTTYYLPNLKGRVVVGKGVSSGSGDWGGSESVAITDSIISHSHNMNSHTHPLSSHTHGTTHAGTAHGSSHSHPIGTHTHPLGAGGSHTHAMWFANTGAPGTTQPRNNTTGTISAGAISNTAGDHTHTIGNSFPETSTQSSTESSGDVSGSSATGSSSPETTGSGSGSTPTLSADTSISVMQKSYVLTHIVRAL